MLLLQLLPGLRTQHLFSLYGDDDDNPVLIPNNDIGSKSAGSLFTSMGAMSPFISINNTGFKATFRCAHNDWFDISIGPGSYDTSSTGPNPYFEPPNANLTGPYRYSWAVGDKNSNSNVWNTRRLWVNRNGFILATDIDHKNLYAEDLTKEEDPVNCTACSSPGGGEDIID